MVIAIYLHTSYILLCILLITFLLISEIWFPFIMHKMNVGLTKDDRLLSAKIIKISHDNVITGEAFFYAEVGQPSQVELFLFHGVRKTK